MLGTVNTVQSLWLARSQALEWECIAVLLNTHVVKLPSKYLGFYPQIGAAVGCS